jgi:hypothetical protein
MDALSNVIFISIITTTDKSFEYIIVILRLPLIWHQLYFPQYMIPFYQFHVAYCFSYTLAVSNVFVLTGLTHLTYVKEFVKSFISLEVELPHF